MNPTDILDLIQNHKWVPIVAAVIFTVVRLAKSDTTFPVNIPSRYRVWAAYVLGLVGAVFQYYAAGGVTWTTAIVSGVISSILAVQTHDTVVGSLRGGKEFVFPGLMIAGARPGPGKPASTPPKADEGRESPTIPVSADESGSEKKP